ncbi:hypothetical protein LO80_09195 [Candidatus Francisella endociliophora]|uniref:Uncharacterized protein n=1 Tax=Candidatus Francisella endociliophora TaxID=653937 RepID=A0A097ERE6_9GAMM|nr:hypothetical protein [Francisella sp. FSC1006]AIT10129.1 hypothetical protein LO80_09195 [Francisella sp. FSC1006]
MKKKILTSVLLVSLVGSAFATKPIMHLQKLREQNKNLEAGNNFISPGSGYSSDAQTLGQQICFAFTDTDKSAGEAVFDLDSVYSFKEIENKFAAGASASAGIGAFGGGFAIDYLKAMKDTDLSYSLNYFNYATNKVRVNLDLSEGGLTPIGDTLYNNVFDKFGVSCGNEIITAYQTGAMLLFGINLKFHNHSDLETFKAKAHASFGNIFNASGYIEKIARENNIDGKVSISAYQIGGKPERLAEILSKDPDKGGYYALTCSMQNMDRCIKAAEGVLDYAGSKETHATDGFSKQYDLSKDENLEPFGIAFADTMDIELIGLDEPDTLVTPQVKEARKKLENDLKENEYYKEHLGAIINGYPVKLDDQYKEKLEDLYTKADDNVNTLTNPVSGGIQCFTKPYKCISVAQDLESKLKPITDEEITDSLESIKYNIKSNSNRWLPGLFVPNGLRGSNIVNYEYIQDTSLGFPNAWRYTYPKIHISGDTLSFDAMGNPMDDKGRWQNNDKTTFKGTLISNNTYKGPFKWRTIGDTINVQTLINPYYFTPYNSDMDKNSDK